MTLFEKMTLIGAIISAGSYFLQIIILTNCPDEHIGFQVGLFRFTVISMLSTIITFFISLIMK